MAPSERFPLVVKGGTSTTYGGVVCWNPFVSPGLLLSPANEPSWFHRFTSRDSSPISRSSPPPSILHAINTRVHPTSIPDRYTRTPHRLKQEYTTKHTKTDDRNHMNYTKNMRHIKAFVHLRRREVRKRRECYCHSVCTRGTWASSPLVCLFAFSRIAEVWSVFGEGRPWWHGCHTPRASSYRRGPGFDYATILSISNT